MGWLNRKDINRRLPPVPDLSPECLTGSPIVWDPVFGVSKWLFMRLGLFSSGIGVLKYVARRNFRLALQKRNGTS